MTNWDDFRLFRAVARAGSLSGAARDLAVSQPTVGRRLSALESRLNTTLFVRTPRGLELTQTGAQLLESAEAMADAAAEADARALGAGRAPEGTVTVSMIESLTLGWAVEALRACRERYPAIDLDIKVDMAVADLHRRQADIALRMVRPTQSRLIARKAGEMEWGFFAADSYLQRAGTPKRFDDLARHDLVMPDETLARYMQPLLEAVSTFADRVVFRSNNAAALIAATCAGYGIGFHSCLLAQSQSYSLRRVLPELAPTRTDIWIVAHEDVRRSARIRAVYDFLGERLVRDAWRFRGD